MAVFLIMVTWFLWSASTWGIGITLAPKVAPQLVGQLRARAQMGIWVGLIVLVIFAVSLNFFLPLGGAIGSWISATWIVVGIFLLARWLLHEKTLIATSVARALTAKNFIPIIVVTILGFSLVIAAWFATAEPMDYDAGLYRLGMINYAAEYRVIPGLANLHSRFGFNSSLGPWTAFIGDGIWEGNGFRLVTGFLFSLFLLEVGLRILVPRRRTPGDFLIVLGWGFLCWVILDDSGRWMSSPSQDIMALICALVAFVFLIDYVNSPVRQNWIAAAALIAGAISAAVRPLGWLLVLLTLITIYVASAWLKPKREFRLKSYFYLTRSLVVVFALAVVMMIRDALISGWLLFPVSAFPLPVDWRAVDPHLDSLNITWWGRAPGLGIDEAQGSSWFGPWLEIFLQSREMKFFWVVLAASVIPVLWARGRHAWRVCLLQVVVSIMPAIVVSIVWFVTAPDVRFGWAGLFAMAAIPIAFVLWAGGYPSWFTKVAFFGALIVAIGINARDGRFELRGSAPVLDSLTIAGMEVNVRLGPVNAVATVPGELGDGTPVVYPRDGENCYMAFPLCLLPDSGEKIEMRGESITEGFRVIR